MSDDPEIVLGGGGADPAPSAPPASFTSGLPTAVGTPIATQFAIPTTPNTTSEGGIIERTINDDGSLTVKITTTTPQPNGYREVKIEYFAIPQGVANVVQMSLDQGDPPSGLYMTKMEQQTLPPGTGAVMSRPPAHDAGNNETVPLATPVGGGNQGYMNPGNESQTTNGARACGICCGIACVVFVAVGIIGGAASSSSSSHHNGSPSWPSWNPPSPSWPTWTPAPVYQPSWPTWPTNPNHRPWWESPPTFSPTMSSRPTTSPYPTPLPSSSLLPTSSSGPSDTPSISNQPSSSPPTYAPFVFPKFTLHPIFNDWPPTNASPRNTPAESSSSVQARQPAGGVEAPVHYHTGAELKPNNTPEKGDGNNAEVAME